MKLYNGMRIRDSGIPAAYEPYKGDRGIVTILGDNYTVSWISGPSSGTTSYYNIKTDLHRIIPEKPIIVIPKGKYE